MDKALRSIVPLSVFLWFLMAPPWIGATNAAETASPSAEAPGTIEQVAVALTIATEAMGIAVIVVGVAIATAIFVREGFGALGWAPAYQRYRANLGRGILLGLELLVAADIINTVAAPLDIRSIGVLVLIVLIRTFLSFSLEVEINGHWPWQESRIKRSAERPTNL